MSLKKLCFSVFFHEYIALYSQQKNQGFHHLKKSTGWLDMIEPTQNQSLCINSFILSSNSYILSSCYSPHQEDPLTK